MAKAFLASDGRSMDYYLARSEGKTANPWHGGRNSRDIIGRPKPFVMQYNYSDGAKTKGDFIYDKLADVPKTGGWNDGKVYIGVPRPSYGGSTSLYVVGTKSAIIRMFEAATVTPEIFVGSPVRVGVYKWKNVLTASIYGVRISAGTPPASAGKHDFVDTDITQLLGLTGKQSTINPGILALPVKNILDGKAG